MFGFVVRDKNTTFVNNKHCLLSSLLGLPLRNDIFKFNENN